MAKNILVHIDFESKLNCFVKRSIINEIQTFFGITRRSVVRNFKFCLPENYPVIYFGLFLFSSCYVKLSVCIGNPFNVGAPEN